MHSTTQQNFNMMMSDAQQQQQQAMFQQHPPMPVQFGAGSMPAHQPQQQAYQMYPQQTPTPLGMPNNGPPTSVNGNNANAQAVLSLMQNPGSATPQPVPSSFGFMNNSAHTNSLVSMLNNNNAGSSNNSTASDDSKRLYEIVDFEEPIKTLDEVFPKSERAEMLADFEACEAMTLLNDPTTMYTLLINNEVFMNDNNHPFLFSTLSGFYKKNYEILFNKYPSLNTYVDFCLAMIIFKKPQDLKNACQLSSSSSGGTLPNLEAKMQVARLIRSRKRYIGKPSEPAKPASPAPSDESTSGQDNGDVDKNSEYNTLPKKLSKHPFYNTKLYAAAPLLFNIGQCLKFSIPSDFAPLFVNIRLGSVARIGSAKQRVNKMALVCNLTRPFIGLLWSRTVKNNGQYYHFSQMDNLGSIIAKMTDCSFMNNSFDYGRTTDLVINHIADPVQSAAYHHDQTTMVFSSKGLHNIAIIDRINIFRVANNTFSTKSFSKYVYVLAENDTSQYNEKVVTEEANKTSTAYDILMDEWEKQYNVTEKDMCVPLKWSLDDPSIHETVVENNSCDDYSDDEQPSSKRMKIEN